MSSSRKVGVIETKENYIFTTKLNIDFRHKFHGKKFSSFGGKVY